MSKKRIAFEKVLSKLYFLMQAGAISRRRGQNTHAPAPLYIDREIAQG
jgi:hypothetical protein